MEATAEPIRVESSFDVGRFHVIPRKNVIEADGHRVRVEPKVMRVLLCLANHAGTDVARDIIVSEVWERTSVRSDVLTNAIWELRKAFGDDPHEPEYIQTVPGKGYRLVAPVNVAFNVSTPALRPRRWVYWVGLAIAFVLGILVANVACPS